MKCLPELPSGARLVVRQLKPLSYGPEMLFQIDHLTWSVFQPRLDSLLSLVSIPHKEWEPVTILHWHGMDLLWDGGHRLLVAKLRGQKKIRGRMILVPGGELPAPAAAQVDEPDEISL